MRRVTRDETVRLNWRMLVNKWTLFVCVTLDAGGINACREACLFQLESAVWVVTIATLHRAFQYFVVEGQIELVLCFAVTTQTKLWLALSEQLQIR